MNNVLYNSNNKVSPYPALLQDNATGNYFLVFNKNELPVVKNYRIVKMATEPMPKFLEEFLFQQTDLKKIFELIKYFNHSYAIEEMKELLVNVLKREDNLDDYKDWEIEDLLGELI